MFLTVHGIVGAAIGAAIGTPGSAFTLGALSHGILDIIPHGDEQIVVGLPRRDRIRKLILFAFVDGVILCAILGFLVRSIPSLVSVAAFAGVLGGVLPDVFQGLAELFPNTRALARFRAFHDYLHLRVIAWESSFPVGMGTQLLTLAIATAFLVS